MGKWKCSVCGGENVQVELPAWFDPNRDFKHVDTDWDADYLSTWCEDCQDHHPLIDEDGEERVGKFDLSLLEWYRDREGGGPQ